MTWWLVLFAATPFLLIVGLLLGLKKPLVVAAPVTLIYTTVLAFGLWGITTEYALAGAGKALIVGLDILLIIFGAIFFLRFLQATKIIEDIEHFLTGVSRDHRVLAVLLAWLFLSFIEGTSGFGTPMAIVAPLLVAIGFPAITAVCVALVGVGTSVAFGAVGTPIRVGLAGLPVTGVPFYAGLTTLVVGTFLPLMLVWTLVRLSPGNNKGAVKEMVPYALLAGISMTLPSFLMTFVDQSFPSLIGPLVGLAIMVPLTMKGILVPKRVWRIAKSKSLARRVVPAKQIARAAVPYLLFIAALLITTFLVHARKVITLAPGVSGTVDFLGAGVLFMIVVMLTALLLQTGWEPFTHAARDAVKTIRKPVIIIITICLTVQLLILSSHNTSGFPSMIAMLTGWLAIPLLPLVAPFMGALGAFLSGSATVSNLLFAPIEHAAALKAGVNPDLVLGLQTVGGGVGNTISLTDIAAVEATVGLHDEERSILKAVAPPVLIYLTAAGILGMIVMYLF